MLSWIPEPRVAGGQEMTYGRSLQRHLAHFNLQAAFTEWASLAQDRAGWRKLVTPPPFKLVSPSCDNQEAHPGEPGGQQRLAKERAAEIARRRADFNATIN